LIKAFRSYALKKINNTGVNKKMKKNVKSDKNSATKTVKQDMTEMLTKMQEQIAAVDRKIDIVLSRISAKLFEERPQAQKPSQQPGNQARTNTVKQGGSFRERIMHKAVCADCKKECEVPFQPKGDRPVYCKDCFSKRRSGQAPREHIVNKPAEVMPLQAQGPKSEPVIEPVKKIEKKTGKKPEKKKPAAKKRK